MDVNRMMSVKSPFAHIAYDILCLSPGDIFLILFCQMISLRIQFMIFVQVVYWSKWWAAAFAIWTRLSCDNLLGRDTF